MRKQTGQFNNRIKLKNVPAVPGKAGNGKKLSAAAVLGIVLFFVFWFSLLFPVPYRQFQFSPARIISSVKLRFSQFYVLFKGGSTSFDITVYQLLAVILAGAALAACGCVFQGSFRNVLAGPSTMGIMSGGTAGLLIYLLVFSPSHGEITYSAFDAAAYASRSFTDIYARQLLTLLGCAAGVGLTLGVSIAAGRGRLSASAMIICGTVFSSITGSAVSLVQYYMIMLDPTDERIEVLRELSMGSFDGINSAGTLLIMGVPIVICLALLIALRRRLDLLALNDDEAFVMGVNIRVLRVAMIAVGTIMTSFVVAFCGHIGFLGFMIPLAGRKLVGPAMERLLPVCMLMGAVLLLLVFDLAYITMMTAYLNVFTSSVGGIVLLMTLLRNGGKRHAPCKG